MNQKRDELLWLAGFFDGEGSALIQIQLPGDCRNRTNKHPVIVPHLAVKIKYGVEVLKLFEQHFGGKIYAYTNRQGYSWNLLGHEKIKIVLQTLLPHLKVKQQIAQRMLELLERWPGLMGIKRSKGECAWSTEFTIEVMETALTLNPPSAKNAKQKAHAIKVRKYIEQLKGEQ